MEKLLNNDDLPLYVYSLSIGKQKVDSRYFNQISYMAGTVGALNHVCYQNSSIIV
jgi:hypothetical protein